LESTSTLAVLAGLGIGAVIGAAALVSNFCALGGVADILFARDWRRMRAWILAAGVAIVGTQVLDAAGVLNIDGVLLPYLLWLPTLLGGLLFGFGMAISGGCINRALVRLGAGSVKSLTIVFVAGLVSALTLAGPLAPLNDALARAGRLDLMVAPEGLHRIFGMLPMVNAEIVRWAFTALIGGGMIVFAVKDDWFRATRDQLMAGLVIGATIPLAWLASGSAMAVDFAAPVGGLFLIFSERAMPLFALATVVGVPVGAFVAGLATRNLAFETFTDRSEIPRNLIGAALMGFGGTIALGCTFGQGLSGLSLLSVGAMLTIAGIVFGCIWGIRFFEAGGVWAGLKLVFKRA
jgi:uncharacterized membrane protein YedE/YeeE